MKINAAHQDRFVGLEGVVLENRQRMATSAWKELTRRVPISSLSPAASKAKGLSHAIGGSLSKLFQQDQAKALQRLVYRSRVTEAYRGSADFQQILKVAVRRNAQNHITGSLALSGDYFVQVLEGPAARLEEILSKLGQDPRHTDLDVLGRWGVTGRIFTGWAMAHSDLADGCPRLHQRFQSEGLGLELVSLLFDAAAVSSQIHI